jgi:hypothetical protein
MHWGPALSLALSGVVLTRIFCPGCIDRTRANNTCEWAGDTAFKVNAADQAQWRHLVSDAQLAEELAVRYSDAEHPHRFGAEAFAAHEANVQAQTTCYARIIGVIGQSHAVTAEQVNLARRTRSPAFDVLVLISYIPLFLATAAAACRRFRNILQADARVIRAVSGAVVAVVVSGFGLLSFTLWRIVLEGLRIGTPNHMGARATGAGSWTASRAVAFFAGEVALFWIVASLVMADETSQPKERQ